MIFRDRTDAGKQLAKALEAYSSQSDAIVIALPRGGVVVGFEVAALLHVPLDIVCPRKIGAPFNPELAIGAITETGEAILSDQIIQEFAISPSYIEVAKEEERKKAQWRLEHYRKGRPSRKLENKTVILVDDGLATGSTMRAAIKTVRAEHAKSIILAVPVAPPDTLSRLEKEVDKTVCLSSPVEFYAVGQFYNFFDQTTDEEVISLLEKANSLARSAK